MAEFAARGLDHTDADSEPWLERLAAEGQRLDDALRWFVMNGEAEPALRLAVALFPYWRDRGLLADGRRWLAEAMDAYEEDAPCLLRAQALSAAGLLAFRQGDDEQSAVLQEQSLEEARTCGERLAEADALLGLARVAFRAGEHHVVRGHCEAALTIAEEVGDLEARAAPLHLLAESARTQGDYKRARELYGASLEVQRALEDRRMESMEMHNLAYVDLHDGAFDLAANGFRDSMLIARRRGDIGQVAYCVLGLAVVVAELGGWERAAELLGKADSLLERAGETLDPAEAAERERIEAMTCEALGTEHAHEMMARGATLALGETLTRSFRDVFTPGAASGVPDVSDAVDSVDAPNP